MCYNDVNNGRKSNFIHRLKGRGLGQMADIVPPKMDFRKGFANPKAGKPPRNREFPTQS